MLESVARPNFTNNAAWYNAMVGLSGSESDNIAANIAPRR